MGTFSPGTTLPDSIGSPNPLQPEHVDLLPGTTELRLRVPLAYFEVASQADRAGASPLK